MERVGEALREIRVRHGCSLEDISRRTRISPRILREMESGDFRSIRGKFYFQQFVREYIRSLGEDPAPFLEQYRLPETEEKEPGASQAAQTVRKIQVYRFRRRRGLRLLLALILLAAAAVFLFAPNRERIVHWFSPESSPAVAGAVFEPGWLQPGRCSPIVSGRNDSICAWLDRETGEWGISRAPASIRAGFSSGCWVQLSRGGRIETARMYKPGEEFHARGYDLRVSLGNPSAVILTVNGIRETRFKEMSRPVTFPVDAASPFTVNNHEPDPVP